MYTLLSGFVKYLLQKEEYSVLILGLDNAGKTVRIIISQLNYLFNILFYFQFLLLLSDHVSTTLLFDEFSQTLLEQTKAILNPENRNVNLQKITATVGLNRININYYLLGTYMLYIIIFIVLTPHFNFLFILPVASIDLAGVRLTFWDLGGQEELQCLWDKVGRLLTFCQPTANIIPYILYGYIFCSTSPSRTRSSTCSTHPTAPASTSPAPRSVRAAFTSFGALLCPSKLSEFASIAGCRKSRRELAAQRRSFFGAREQAGPTCMMINSSLPLFSHLDTLFS